MAIDTKLTRKTLTYLKKDKQYIVLAIHYNGIKNNELRDR